MRRADRGVCGFQRQRRQPVAGLGEERRVILDPDEAPTFPRTRLAVVASPAISTHAFYGVAIQGATAGNKVRFKSRGFIEMPVTGASAASVGAIVYASDDGTLTLTASTNVPVGYVHRHVTSTTCIVEFRSTAERDTAVA